MIFNKTRIKELEERVDYFRTERDTIQLNFFKLQKEHDEALQEIDSLKNELSTQKDTLIAKFKNKYQEKLKKSIEDSKKLYEEAIIGREDDKKKINNLIKGIKLQKNKNKGIDISRLKKKRNDLEKALNKKRLTKEQNQKKQELLNFRRS